MKPFRVRLAALRGFFDEVARFEAWADRAFSTHRRMVLSYETDLCGAFSRAVNRVYSFLGLHSLVTWPAFKKLNTVPPWDQVVNYRALQDAFRTTRYARFFPDPAVDWRWDA